MSAPVVHASINAMGRFGLTEIIILGALIAVVGVASPASADIPGPPSACETGQCESCWRTYDRNNPLSVDDSDGFDKCAALLREKGWVTSCSDRKERGEDVWFCPAGYAQAGRRGGCAGCTVSADESVTLLGVGAALGVATALQARRRRRREPLRSPTLNR